MPDIVPLDMPASYWRGKAQRAYRAGSLREAVRLYRAALRKQDDGVSRRELAQVYADMGCIGSSDRLYCENLAHDAGDTDSLYGLARNRSLAGDERGMADLLDLYLRLAPCGEQADRARDILWELPRDPLPPRRMRRAQVLCAQAEDRQVGQLKSAMQLARRSWQRGKTKEGARLLCRLHLQARRPRQALRFALAACDLDPRDMQLRLLLAAALRECGLRASCRAALKQAMPMCESLIDALAFCQCAMALEEYGLAAELSERMLEAHPHSIELKTLLAAALCAEDRQLERVDSLLREAMATDEEDPLSQAVLLRASGETSDASAQLRQTIDALKRVQWAAEREDGDALHREAVRVMRLPLPGMADIAVRIFLQAGDEAGLRLALLENDLSPTNRGMIFEALRYLGSPMPCFAREDGRLYLLPQKPRPPYDGDLHDLIRRLLRLMEGSVPLDVVVREVPPLWQRLPESARRHCAESADDVWPRAFAAYLSGCAGDRQPRRWLQGARKKRMLRAYEQLIRRSQRPYEMH